MHECFVCLFTLMEFPNQPKNVSLLVLAEIPRLNERFSLWLVPIGRDRVFAYLPPTPVGASYE